MEGPLPWSAARNQVLTYEPTAAFVQPLVAFVTFYRAKRRLSKPLRCLIADDPQDEAAWRQLAAISIPSGNPSAAVPRSESEAALPLLRIA